MPNVLGGTDSINMRLESLKVQIPFGAVVRTAVGPGQWCMEGVLALADSLPSLLKARLKIWAEAAFSGVLVGGD
jgi:hypothetical protein